MFLRAWHQWCKTEGLRIATALEGMVYVYEKLVRGFLKGHGKPKTARQTPVTKDCQEPLCGTHALDGSS